MKRQELGTLFKEARIKGRLTQEEVAEKARVEARSIQRLEAGQANPTYETMYDVALACGWTLNLVLGSSDDEDLLNGFRALPDRDRRLAIGYIQALLDKNQAEPSPVANIRD